MLAAVHDPRRDDDETTICTNSHPDDGGRQAFATERVPIVGDVASLGGVTVSNVRFYEAERLIHATRTAGNQCLYGPVSSTYASFK